MKPTWKVILLVVAILVISIEAYSHKSEDGKPVHQWIVEQGASIWLGQSENISALGEFNSYLDNGNNHPDGQVVLPVGIGVMMRIKDATRKA